MVAGADPEHRRSGVSAFLRWTVFEKLAAAGYLGNDLTDAAVKQASETMDSHELLKVAVQDGSGLTAKEAADKLAGQIGAQVVQVIGNRFVLYRKSSRNDIEHIRLVRE